MKSIIKKNKFEITVIALFSLSYVIYCNYIMVELPHMSWFDQFFIVEGYYNKTLTLSQLVNRYCEHGLFGYNVLFLLNLIVFKLTTFFDVYLNAINVMTIGIICVYSAKKTFTENSKRYKLCVILICIFEFSFIQSSSGAMETQVRLGILFFVIAAVMIDKVFMKDVTIKYLMCTIIMIFISINIFGTLYSYAGIPVIFLIILINLVRSKKINKNQLSIFFTYIISILLYLFQYGLIGKDSMVSGNLLNGIVGILSNPMYLLKSILGYNANTVLGYAIFVDKVIPDSVYLFIGVIVTAIFIFSVGCFYKSRMYKITMFPIMLLGYSFFVLILIVIGRYAGDWGWFASYWYTVHTKLAAIGCLWILTYSSLLMVNKNYKPGINMGIIFLVICIAIGNYVELKRAPFVRAYYLEMQQYLFAESINDLPITDGITPLLASPEMTINAINLMREHKLSIYKKNHTYEDLKQLKSVIGTTLDTANIISGYFEDGWSEKSAEFEIKTGPEGKLVLNCYYPKEITGKETGTVYIDGEANPFKITEANFIIELSVKKDSIINVKIVNDFSFPAEPPDVRELSFVLGSVQGK